MRKYGISRRKQIMMAIPRIALALLIGVVIARPLEMKIFEKEINVKMTKNLHDKIQLNDSLLAMEYKNQLANAETERQRLLGRKLAIEDTLHNLQSAYLQEADGTGGSRQRGIDNITRLKQNAFNLAGIQFAPELLLLEQNMKSQDSLTATAKASMEDKRKQFEQTAMANMGFLERNKALADLSAEEGRAAEYSRRRPGRHRVQPRELRRRDVRKAHRHRTGRRFAAHSQGVSAIHPSPKGRLR
jgi:hypothetical protein